VERTNCRVLFIRQVEPCQIDTLETAESGGIENTIKVDGIRASLNGDCNTFVARIWDFGYRSNASIVIWLRLDVPKHRLRQDARAALYAKPRVVCGAEIKEIDDTLCSVLVK
jgi:hypothetical protein